MSDESDNESAPLPPGPSGADDPIAVLVDVEPLAEEAREQLADFSDPHERVKRGPPPKPRSRPPLPSVRPPKPESRPPPPMADGLPLPPTPSVESPTSSAPPRASSSAPPGESAVSIKPMRMIKLGADRVRSEPPPSSLERLSSRPPA